MNAHIEHSLLFVLRIGFIYVWFWWTLFFDQIVNTTDAKESEWESSSSLNQIFSTFSTLFWS
jgi:hypothetical protein